LTLLCYLALASSKPWMVTQRNPEIEDFFDIDFSVAYIARWPMPLGGSNSNLYYSFEVAAVHFLNSQLIL
jgi:hypothetical protein